MSVRALRAWRPPVPRLAAPAILVAAGLSLGPVPPGARPVARPVADQIGLMTPTLMLPFAATPRVVPFTVRTVVIRRASPQPAVAPAPILPPTSTGATIPGRVLAAYVNAAAQTNTSEPNCRVSWALLAAIGSVDSQDRAIGPMHLRPATWAGFAADGNHDGVRNPRDIDDAALAASDYLCTVTPGLNRPAHLIRAIHAYHHSYKYVRAVLTAMAGYLQVNPATLGMNRLPKHRRAMIAMQIVPPAEPPTTPRPPAVPVPKATPSLSWTPSPLPTSSPMLPRLPQH